MPKNTPSTAIWQLLVTDKPGDSARRIVISGPGALIGSAEQADVHIPGAAAVVAEIRRHGDADFHLEIRDRGAGLRCNGSVPAAADQPIFSGDTLQIGEMAIAMDVRFAPRQQRPSLRLMSMITGTLLITIVVSELFIIGWLPQQLNRQEIWGVEIARQKTLALLDNMRTRIEQWDSPDERTKNVLQLIGFDLRRYAVYLRDHAPELDATQLTAIYDSLAATQSRLDKLQDGTLLPPPAEVTPDPFLKKTLPAAP